MLTRLDTNISKISFLYINISNFLLDEKCQYFFYWMKMSIICFKPKC